MEKIINFIKQAELGMALALVTTLGIMIIPISPFMMDMFITITLAISTMIYYYQFILKNH